MIIIIEFLQPIIQRNDDLQYYSKCDNKFLVQLRMSCFTGCVSKNRSLNHIKNRTTEQWIRFNESEIEQLHKKFLKVSVYCKVISREAFKKNMGILGLHCAQEFSERLFNAFDLDSDGQINFNDFIEYMEILKCGRDVSKARISFKMIAKKEQGTKRQKSTISQSDFMEFLNDFFNSWSSITNISITEEIRQRTNQYVSFLFNKVKKQTGRDEINMKYYTDKLYKDKDYIQSFEFITQGMADIFIHDKEIHKNNPEAMLYKIIKQLKQINSTVFDMTNQDSYLYEPVRTEETPPELPNFKSIFKKPEPSPFSFKNNKTSTSQFEHKVRYSRPEDQKPMRKGGYDTDTHSNTRSHFLNESRKIELRQSYENTKLHALQKKLKYIQQKIGSIVEQTKSMYAHLVDKFQNQKGEFRKGKQSAAKNVHKRIKKNEGKMIFIGDDNWNLVLNMMIGIQMAVRSVRGFQEMIYQEPKDFELKYYFELVPRRFGDEEYNSTIYSFTDYAPNTFNHIRQIFKIDNEDYIDSIGPNRLMASLMMGEVNSMTSLTSQGKSGSFFYYTADGKYMLKTIQYRQYKFLRTILKDYYYYIKQNPQTLITKFYGLHKLIEKDDKGDQITRSYFVIMANVFNTKEKIVQRFDIKGSWFGRETHDKDPSATKKDNDFKKRDPIYLETEERQRLLKIIRSDADFFEQHNIIDYSLLIGVIKKSENRESQNFSQNKNYQSRIVRQEDENDLTFQNRQSKIFVSVQQNPESYIFGIIDILTLYDSRKMFEYYFKRLVYGEGISAVPAPQYAERFKGFIQNTVFPKEDNNELRIRT